MGKGATGSLPMEKRGHIITKNSPEWAKSKKALGIFSAREKATEAQWWLVDTAIKAFIAKYPTQWMEFQRQLKSEATEWQLATKEHKELRKRNWRNSASFPIVYTSEGEDSLLPVIEKIIPRLIHKESKNYIEFLKRYPFFCPAQKVNASEY